MLTPAGRTCTVPEKNLGAALSIVIVQRPAAARFILDVLYLPFLPLLLSMRARGVMRAMGVIRRSDNCTAAISSRTNSWPRRRSSRNSTAIRRPSGGLKRWAESCTDLWPSHTLLSGVFNNFHNSHNSHCPHASPLTLRGSFFAPGASTKSECHETQEHQGRAKEHERDGVAAASFYCGVAYDVRTGKAGPGCPLSLIQAIPPPPPSR